MHDAATNVPDAVVRQSQFLRVGVQRLNLHARHRVKNCRESGCSRRVVIGHRNHRLLPPRLSPRQFQPFKRLWAGDFVHQMAVNVEQRRSVALRVNHMRIEKFVVERPASHINIRCYAALN